MTDFKPSGTLQFGAFFQGVNSSTVWKIPEAGSQIDFSSFTHLAKTAEKGNFVAFFLAEGLRPREQNGELYELDVAGRPDSQTMLAALASVTDHIGLVATQNATFNDPVDLARRFQTLDFLSSGRAGWNVVTTDNAFTGANFRRGAYLDHADRYTHAQDVLDISKLIWSGKDVHYQGKHYSVDYHPGLPKANPVIFQAGMSPEGRDFAACNADVIFTRFGTPKESLEFRKDLVARCNRVDRDPNTLKIMPAAQFIVAPTEIEAFEKKKEVAALQIGPQQAIAYLEQFWGRDLSSYDPDGPLPDVPPAIDETDGSRGTAFQASGIKKKIAAWHQLADDNHWSIRDLATYELVDRQNLIVGSYSKVVDTLADYARSGIVDGFNVCPWLIPTGLDDVVEHLVPLLQDRGIYPTEYAGENFRENLGLRGH